MIPEQITEITIVAKYILIALAIIGAIVLGNGIYRQKRKLIERGVYIIILSVVLGVCGYFIYEKTKRKSYEVLDNTYITY